MKLGTLKSNVKDGELVVVSRDNKKAVRVPSLAQNLSFSLMDILYFFLYLDSFT